MTDTWVEPYQISGTPFTNDWHLLWFASRDLHVGVKPETMHFTELNLNILLYFSRFLLSNNNKLNVFLRATFRVRQRSLLSVNSFCGNTNHPWLMKSQIVLRKTHIWVETSYSDQIILQKLREQWIKYRYKTMGSMHPKHRKLQWESDKRLLQILRNLKLVITCCCKLINNVLQLLEKFNPT